MGLHNYLVYVRKLNNMGRWATEFMHQRTTVSEHSFLVAQIGQMLALIEEENGGKVDWGRLFRKLINHDVIESITGDILSTTKYKNPEIASALSVIEKELAEETFFAEMEQPYRSLYRNLLFDGKDDSLEGRILRAADNIDALMECIFEVKLNNIGLFEEKYHAILKKLKESNLVSVRYFIANVLPGLVADCERLAKKTTKYKKEEER
ncbi:HD domain-containing protein [Anaeroselena agilis]|uniref:HD domain-containing protein n=1 Tax=Anaeroselena agilis TaxID=3063788 RepID=A0ABU3NYQ8_9FIRM|nr:HD domain-containing protein [Selenomonadales bacterium 4137-cl]